MICSAAVSMLPLIPAQGVTAPRRSGWVCGSRDGRDGTAWAGALLQWQGGHQARALRGAGRCRTHSPCAEAPLPSPAGFICIRSGWVCSSHRLATRQSRGGRGESQGAELGLGRARSQQGQNVPIPVPILAWCGLVMEPSSASLRLCLFLCLFPCVWNGWVVLCLLEAVWDTLSCLLAQVSCWYLECLSRLGQSPLTVSK